MHRVPWVLVPVLCLAFALCPSSSGVAHANGLNNLKAGVTGILEFPADPVMHVVFPPEDFIDELPAGQVTGRVLGLFSGTFLGAYRLVMGVTDLAFAPFWVMPTMSPPARWDIFEVEYE